MNNELVLENIMEQKKKSSEGNREEKTVIAWRYFKTQGNTSESIIG